MERENIHTNHDITKRNFSGIYESYKDFNGRKYTGMKVGGRHKWFYDRGEWNEKKVTPDKWEIRYAVNKRRAWEAPNGSGAPIGTEYHWYILAHQIVRKLDANNYSTSLTGLKYKLAHKRAGNALWNRAVNQQRKDLIRILEDLVVQLKSEE